MLCGRESAADPICFFGLVAACRKPKPVASLLPKLVEAAVSGRLKPAMNAPRSISLDLPLSNEGLACRLFGDADEPLSRENGMAREVDELLPEAGDASWSAR